MDDVDAKKRFEVVGLGDCIFLLEDVADICDERWV